MCLGSYHFRLFIQDLFGLWIKEVSKNNQKTIDTKFSAEKVCLF